jgi:multidrug efflux pump
VTNTAVAHPPDLDGRTLVRELTHRINKNNVDQLAPKVDEFAKGLSAGYSVAIGGSVEESAKSQAPIAAVVPLMLFIMATILMIQLQSFHPLFLVFAVAPLA